MYWAGHTLEYDDRFQANLTSQTSNHWTSNYGIGTTFTLYFYNPTAFTWEGRRDINTQNVWTNIYYARGPYTGSFSTQYFLASANVSVPVENTVENMSYEHVCTWQKDTAFEVCQSDKTDWARISNYQTWTSSNLLDTMTKAGTMSGFARYSGSTATYKSGGHWYNQVAAQFLDNQNRKMFTIGMLPGTFKSSEIRQFAAETYKNYKNNIVKEVTLEQGLPLAYGEKDDVIEWTPSFDLGLPTAYNTITKAKFSFSTTPFTDKNNAENLIDLSTDKSGLYVVEVDKSTPKKIKFTMPTTGVVYMKCWPSFTDDALISSQGWDLYLDLEKCGTYLLTTIKIF